MISIFDIANLKELLKDFYLLSNIRSTVFNEEFTEIVSYPSDLPEFCSIIRNDEHGLIDCHLSDKKACQKAKDLKKTYIYTCHAGLTEAISPIIIDNVIIGYMIFGHISQHPDMNDNWASVHHRCESYDIDMTELKKSLKKCRYFDHQYIEAATKIMETIATYLCVAHMARLQTDRLPVQIDTYISQHYNEDLTCQSLCNYFGISRSKLYLISSQIYGIGIAEYIRNLRIEHAKQLLMDTSLSIKEIALQVGIQDYNYFSKIFKKIVNETPRSFRNRR